MALSGLPHLESKINTAESESETRRGLFFSPGDWGKKVKTPPLTLPQTAAEYQ